MSETEKVVAELEWFRQVLRKGGKVPEYYEAQADILTKAINLLKPSAVRIAKWVHSTVYTSSHGFELAKCKCSNCGHEEFAISYNVTHGKYCPHCGADMRGINDV